MNKIIKTHRNESFNCRQAGMTLIELVVVLAIFIVMSSIVMFNYKRFQAKVDIKVLASDIALKIVEAQKSALSGKLPLDYLDYPSDWKPSYGVHFSKTDKKGFIYFADSNSNNSYDSGADPIIDQPIITTNNFIEGLQCMGNGTDDLDIVFRRPDSRALIQPPCPSDVEIIISSSMENPIEAKIIVSPSGRIQVR